MCVCTVTLHGADRSASSSSKTQHSFCSGFKERFLCHSSWSSVERAWSWTSESPQLQTPQKRATWVSQIGGKLAAGNAGGSALMGTEGWGGRTGRATELKAGRAEALVYCWTKEEWLRASGLESSSSSSLSFSCVWIRELESVCSSFLSAMQQAAGDHIHSCCANALRLHAERREVTREAEYKEVAGIHGKSDCAPGSPGRW